MSREEVISIINGFLIEEFEADSAVLLPEANMHKALDLDSLDYVDLVVLIEENFGFKMTGEDFKEVQTFKQFYDFVTERVN
ncbi:MAG: acyl carrier protein [Flavobacteriales bacterium]|nr:acyl carrier protein [Flavobacteriales bacterium]